MPVSIGFIEELGLLISARQSWLELQCLGVPVLDGATARISLSQA